MEWEQGLVEPDGFEHGGVGVGAGCGLPAYELVRRVEDGAVCRELEGILRFGGGLLAGGIELQGLVGDEIVESGPVTVGHGALLEQAIPGADGRGLEDFLRSEGLLELLVNFGKEARQVPGGEVLARLRGGGGALHEAPPVLLEVLPVDLKS